MLYALFCIDINEISFFLFPIQPNSVIYPFNVLVLLDRTFPVPQTKTIQRPTPTHNYHIFRKLKPFRDLAIRRSASTSKRSSSKRHTCQWHLHAGWPDTRRNDLAIINDDARPRHDRSQQSSVRVFTVSDSSSTKRKPFTHTHVKNGFVYT